MPTSLSEHTANEMHFITKGGALKVRTINNLPGTILEMAKALEARYAVLACDWSVVSDCPIWAVYDIDKAHTRLPRGDMSLPMPTKEFITPSADPAVMYALALQGGS